MARRNPGKQLRQAAMTHRHAEQAGKCGQWGRATSTQEAWGDEEEGREEKRCRSTLAKRILRACERVGSAGGGGGEGGWGAPRVIWPRSSWDFEKKVQPCWAPTLPSAREGSPRSLTPLPLQNLLADKWNALVCLVSRPRPHRRPSSRWPRHHAVNVRAG